MAGVGIRGPRAPQEERKLGRPAPTPSPHRIDPSGQRTPQKKMALAAPPWETWVLFILIKMDL